MKSLFTFLFLLVISCDIFAQSPPQGFNFQALAKDGSGIVVVNAAVGIRISILDGSTSGPVVYAETTTALTNEKGVFSLIVGQGSIVTGLFQNINWGSATKFIQIEMDASGGSSYTFMGVQQLMSVPYALYAQSSGSQWQNGAGGAIYYNGGNVGIGVAAPSQKLHINGAVKIGAYTLPATDGTAGQVLTTDGAGNVTWQAGSGGGSGSGSNANTLIYTVRGF